MAQTAVDLPDPLESKGEHALNNADDLLAQLAGEEVDRLLSEADGHPLLGKVELPPAASAADAASPAATDGAANSPAKTDTDPALDELLGSAASSGNEVALPANGDVASVVAADEAMVDGLLDEI